MKRLHANVKHYIGDRFGQLTIVDNYPFQRNRKWKMKCDCGFVFIAYSANVITGKTTRCLKCQKLHLSKLRTANLLGKRYGKLVVQEREAKKWLCLCDCGNTCLRSTSSLNSTKKQGSISSCQMCNKKIKLDASSAQRKRREIIHKSRLGKKFRNFKILSFFYKMCGDRNKSFYKCKCKCGKVFNIRSDSLDSYFSCGCYHNKVASENMRKLSDVDIENAYQLMTNCGYEIEELSEIYNVNSSYMYKKILEIKDK